MILIIYVTIVSMTPFYSNVLLFDLGIYLCIFNMHCTCIFNHSKDTAYDA